VEGTPRSEEEDEEDVLYRTRADIACSSWESPHTSHAGADFPDRNCRPWQTHTRAEEKHEREMSSREKLLCTDHNLPPPLRCLGKVEEFGMKE